MSSLSAMSCAINMGRREEDHLHERKGLVASRAISDASIHVDEPSEFPDLPPADNPDTILSLVHEEAPEATGHAIAASPGAVDKPERFFSWLVATNN